MVAFTISPAIWTIATGFKTEQGAIAFPPQWIPSPFVLNNFTAILRSSAPRFFLNTMIVAAGAIAMSLLISIPAAYAATRFYSHGVDRLMTTILIISNIPTIIVLVSLYAIFIRTSLINTYPLLIIVYTAQLIGQVVWFIKGFIENIPIEFEEAAYIDGCNRKMAIRYIVLPLIRPGIASMAIYIFVFIWNDFLTGSILTTTQQMRTVQVGLVSLLDTGFGIAWGQFGAYVALAFAPTLLLFLLFQKWFIAGLTSGGLKA